MMWLAVPAVFAVLVAALVVGVLIIGDEESLPVTLGVGVATLILIGVGAVGVWNFTLGLR